jgi:hypothetical protein
LNLHIERAGWLTEGMIATTRRADATLTSNSAGAWILSLSSRF